MKAALPAILLSSLVLGGCCTSLNVPEAGRIDGQEWGDTSLCGIFSGWGSSKQPQRSEAAYTPVTAEEYASYLCDRVDLEDYATCANRVNKAYREARESPIPAGSSTRGPFAILFEDELYVGSYWSELFVGSFQVFNDRNACTGSYNAYAGETKAVFKVSCDDGRRGTAQIVRDRYGRDGIGVVQMNDGTEGTILFGPQVAELARGAR